MTTFRLISLPLHGALEMLLGLALLVVPFLAGFGLAGTVVCVAVGAVIVGLSLGPATTDTAGMDVATHHAYDLGLVVGLLGASAALSIAGDPLAGLVTLAAALVALALNLTTRYSLRT